MKVSKRYEAILFDLDGTLIESMDINFSAWKTSLLEMSIEYDLDKNWYFVNEGRKVADLAAEFLGQEKSNQELVSRLIELKELYFTKLFEFKVYKGVQEILENAKSENIKCAIVTAARKDRLRNTVPYKFLSNFDCIVTGESTIEGKPSPEPYNFAIESMGIDRQKALVIENAPLGIKAAKAAGIVCYSIASTLSKEYLKESDMIFDSMKLLNDYMFEVRKK